MSVNAEFVERYQLELAREPKSRVFAPLAEAYRKMGLLEEAKRICLRGCQFHPDFAGGHVAFAKVLIDLKEFSGALPHLEKATRLSPDNILAHSLMGETLIQLRRPKDALNAFKMVLFLNPDDQKAQESVRKWEFLTADDYDEKMFEMKPGFEPVRVEQVASKAKSPEDELEEILEESVPSARPTGDTRLELAQRHARGLERAISLADAFTIRNDLDAALKVVEDAIRLLGHHPELDKRASLLAKRLQVLNDTTEDDDDVDSFTSPGNVPNLGGPFATAPPELPAELEMPEDMGLDLAAGDEVSLETPEEPASDRRREKLEALLRRISERRV